MKQRTILYGLLGVVATAAAVLSFAALRDLAVTCGFSPQLAWLLPVVVDAGAAAGSLAWLGSAAPTARTYGRTLALLLLASSVGGNALGHGLAAYEVHPHWGVVVGVSAIAPAVLGALVHLVVLVGRSAATRPTDEESTPDQQPFVWAVDETAALDHAGFGELADQEPTDPTDADRPEVDPPMTDADIIAEVREWAVDLGRRPSRDEMLRRYEIGATRCRRLRNTLGWIEPADQPTSGRESRPT